MFYAGSIGNLNSFREIEFDYGLVPYPTGEEGAEYQSFVTGQLQPCAIPTSNKNADFRGYRPRKPRGRIAQTGEEIILREAPEL